MKFPSRFIHSVKIRLIPQGIIAITASMLIASVEADPPSTPVAESVVQNIDSLVDAAHTAYSHQRYRETVALLRERLRAPRLSEERRAQLWMLVGHAGLRSSDPELVDEAITAFGKASEFSETWKNPALYYQGNAKVLLNRPDEALAIYEALLERKLPAAFRLRTKMARGVALFLMAQTDPAHLVPASEMFGAVANDEAAGLSMRLEAFCRKTKIHVAAEQWRAAMESAKQAKELCLAHNQQGVLWAQRALHEVALSEAAREQWQSAVDLLEEAAQLAGPMTADCERQAEAWRLRHFLWE